MRRLQLLTFVVPLLSALACNDATSPPSSAGPLFSTSLPASPLLLASSGHILFTRILPPSEARWVFKMDATGANVTKLANGYAAVWKPDGSKIAFSCGANICVMNNDGTRIVQLTSNVLVEVPAWSGSSLAFPNGRIAFDGQDPTGWHIYVMNPDVPGVVQQLTIGAFIDGSADWSPDGSMIAFQRYVKHVTSPSQVFVMNADGSVITQKTLGGGMDPAWSPDGKWIAFDSNRSGTSQIYVMSSSGETTTAPAVKITTSGGSLPDWSLNGTRIVFRCQPPGKPTNICTINSDGTGGVVDLTNSRQTEQWPEWGP
jgi:Tol biopolymer transport system component